MTVAEFKAPLPIANEDAVFRQAHTSQLGVMKEDKNKRFPKPSHFKPDPDGLSVHWDRFIDVEGVFTIIGLSYRTGTTEYKDPKMFCVFSFPVGFVRAVEGVEDVIHTPFFNGDPASVGCPNNYSHSSILYPDDEEIRLKLSDYCRSNYEGCICTANFEMLEKAIAELRERLDETPFHRLS